jgi:hypothetical protein
MPLWVDKAMKGVRKLRELQHPPPLAHLLREFLTPQVWQPARQTVPHRRSSPRSNLQAVVLLWLAMTWSAGHSERQRFDSTRGFDVLSLDGRPRPGQTRVEFPKALSRIPAPTVTDSGRGGPPGDFCAVIASC